MTNKTLAQVFMNVGARLYFPKGGSEKFIKSYAVKGKLQSKVVSHLLSYYA